MVISFSKYTGKENFNGKDYPIGTTFTTIFNQMSGLTYNKNFILDSYKNTPFCNYHIQVLENLSLNKLYDLKLDRLNSLSKDNLFLNENIEVEIENIKLNSNDFKNLVIFVAYFDEIIRLALKDKRLNKREKFIYYFTVIHDYKIPYATIEDIELLKKYTDTLKKSYQESSSCTNPIEHYDVICKNDTQILREIGKSQNIIYKYDCKDFIQVLLISYIYILENNLNLKRCKNCGRFFIAQNNNQDFCDNIRPQKINESDEEYSYKKISCREFNKKFPNHKNNEVEKAIRKVYLRIRKRIREGNETEEYLNQWKSDVEYERTRLIRDDYYINWILYESDTHQKRGGKKYGCQRTNKK